jgi:AcrR family transcriptional regulator
MGVVERRAREKEALRTKIIEATSQLMVEEGVESVSIRRIAERIEYSPATIYLYFKDKAELIDAICEELFGQMVEVLGSVGAEETDPLKKLRAGMRGYIEFGMSHPSHYLAVFGSVHQPTEEPRPDQPNDAKRLGMEAFEILRQILRLCINQGVLPECDVETTSHAAWMCLHGITILMITTYGGTCPVYPDMTAADRNHLIDSALDLVIAGLRNCALAPMPDGFAKK